MMNAVRNFVNTIKDRARNDPALLALHLGTAIGLFGFASSDQLSLRTCAVISGISGIVFNLTRKPKPILGPVYWSVAFFIANGYNINKLLSERADVKLDDEEKEIYVHHFLSSGIRPKQFKRIMEGGKYRVLLPNTRITEQGKEDKAKKVYLLLKGKLDVQVDGEDIALLNGADPQCFVGEVGLLEAEKKLENSPKYNIMAQFMLSHNNHLHEKPSDVIPHEILNDCPVNSATVTVRPGANAHIIEWDRAFFLELLIEHSELSSRLRALLLASVLGKLRKTGSETNKKTYAALLKACLACNEVNALEKKALRKFRSEHHIDIRFHNQVLHENGWTNEEFAEGMKHVDEDETMKDKVGDFLQKKLIDISSQDIN